MIPRRVGIQHRDKEVEKREEVGHWEVDTMVSGKRWRHHVGGSNVLGVAVERKSRYTRIRKIPNLRPGNMNIFLLNTLCTLPLQTLTYDNGIENKYHTLLIPLLKVVTFFCDPYSSWQKGTVENTIGRIRRFLPKACNVGIYSDMYIQQVEDWLNHTPRKCLNYQTPYEVMTKDIKGIQ
jgi:transposase, IS30 family